MLTGEIRNQIDRIWDTFWTGGISNPREVIEQLTPANPRDDAAASNLKRTFHPLKQGAFRRFR